MRFARLTIATLPLLLVGCGPATIDASSDAAMKESMVDVRNGLDETERAEFDKSLQMILMDAAVPGGNIFAAAGRDPSVAQATLRSSLDGKTATDVNAMASSIRVARAEKQREQVLGEIAELQEKKVRAEAATGELAKFAVTRSRFYREEGYLGKQSVVELGVTNGTPHAVARAYFEGTLASPGRSVPWVKDTFNYPIAGGLEPGETAEWKLKPSSISTWARAEAPEDAVLTVTVTRLDGADGKALFDAAGFNDDAQKRLDVLKQELETLEKLITLQ